MEQATTATPVPPFETDGIIIDGDPAKGDPLQVVHFDDGEMQISDHVLIGSETASVRSWYECEDSGATLTYEALERLVAAAAARKP